MSDKYISQRINPEILSTLDVVSEGKVVSAETWNKLWSLVIQRINTVDSFCTGIQDIIQTWKESEATLSEALKVLQEQYVALEQNFVHYGSEEPVNPNIRFWIEEVPLDELQRFVTYAEMYKALSSITITDPVGSVEDSGGEIFNTYSTLEFDVKDYPQYNACVLNDATPTSVLQSGSVFRNKAISPGTSVTGASNVAGCKAYKIVARDFDNKTYTINENASVLCEALGVELDTQVTIFYATWLFKMEADAKGGNNRSELVETLATISEGNSTNQCVISVETFTELENPAYKFAENYSYIRFYDKNKKPLVELGDTVIEGWSYAGGINNIAAGLGSYVTGRDNVADGAYSFVAGRSNKAGYTSFVAGRNNLVRQYGAGFGRNNISRGRCGFVSGESNTLLGVNASAQGEGLQISHDNAHAVGKYNSVRKERPINLYNAVPNTVQGVSINELGQVSYNLAKDLTPSSMNTYRHCAFTGFNDGVQHTVRFVINNTCAADMNFSLFGVAAESDGGPAFYSDLNKQKIKHNPGHTLTPGLNIVQQTFTLNSDKTFLSCRVNEGVYDATVVILAMDELFDILDTDVVNSVGNGVDFNKRSNTFVTYKDGHAEVQSMFESPKAVVQKQYVDYKIQKTIKDTEEQLDETEEHINAVDKRVQTLESQTPGGSTDATWRSVTVTENIINVVVNSNKTIYYFYRSAEVLGEIPELSLNWDSLGSFKPGFSFKVVVDLYMSGISIGSLVTTLHEFHRTATDFQILGGPIFDPYGLFHTTESCFTDNVSNVYQCGKFDDDHVVVVFEYEAVTARQIQTKINIMHGNMI